MSQQTSPVWLRDPSLPRIEQGYFNISGKFPDYKILRTMDQESRHLALNFPIFPNNNFYYEAKMTRGNNSIALGITPDFYVGPKIKGASEVDWDILLLSGWPYDASYTYHGDTGRIWHRRSGSLEQSVSLKVNDVVGCGLDVPKGIIFFTVNGEKLDVTFTFDKDDVWFPNLGFRGEGTEIELNFGLSKPFVYNLTKKRKAQFPPPKTFADDWGIQIGFTFNVKENLILDHLKDTTIISKGGEEIKCHGLVLSIRSSVFKTILEPEKKTENTINIADFDASTISKMLYFIYSDDVDEDEIDMELLGIANMYQIEALQTICEKKLCDMLDHQNVLDAWMGANLFKREEFLKACESYLNTHWIEVKKTETFSRLMRENTEGMANLAIKMLTTYVDTKHVCKKVMSSNL